MDYIAFLADAIARLHSVGAEHVETVPVREEFQGTVVWVGEVEVFGIEGHPEARQCFAWGFTPDSGGMKAVTVLAVPPITDARRAVQAYVASLVRSDA